MSTGKYVEVMTNYDSKISKCTYQEYIQEDPLFMRPFICKICLWEFESESELHIHNYLEHLITNHIENKNNETLPFIQD